MDKKIKVLVVDDSAAVRRALTTGLEEDPEIAVVGSARDGADAVKKVLALNPDVVTLDLEMPGMNGIQALEKIMQERPTPVVLVSSISRKGAEVTVRALELGAVDFVLKDGSGGKASVESLLSELRAKLRHAVGPKALRSVVPALPVDFPLPVMIVQHLPPGFTAQMAQGLDEISAVLVEEGQPNMPLLLGRVIIAPGGVHMLVSDERSVKLSLTERENGVRPSADPLMASAADVYGSSVLGLVLTGMGRDGTEGCRLIKEAGGEVIVENESTCVVYGMSKSVVESGYADLELPLSGIVPEMVALCSARKAPVRATK